MQPSPLFDFIAKQNTAGLTNDNFIKKLAAHHPYFTPAQFYLLQQIKDTDAAYNQQAAKTAILFNNSYWLHFQLQHAATATIFAREIAATATHGMPVENADNDDDVAIAAPLFTKEEPKEPEPPHEAITAATDTINEQQPLTEEQLMLAENADNDDDDAEMEQEIAPIKITIPNMEPHINSDTAPTFEPMHLVDYFASQGIKLSDEVQTADKLGKQLKSFTEWLKTMKKIHTTDTEASAVISDIAIQALAAKSNKEGEIVTEAMADVLLQQGKVGKAVEVYQKLSLLNPSKSAFFAAKIEQLKGS